MNRFAGKTPLRAFPVKSSSRNCVSRVTEPGTAPSSLFPPSRSVVNHAAPPRFAGKPPVKSQSPPSSSTRFPSRYASPAEASDASLRLSGGNQAEGKAPVSLGLSWKRSTRSWCSDSAHALGKTPVRSFRDASSVRKCRAHAKPSPGSEPVSALSRTSSVSRLLSKAYPWSVSHTSGTLPRSPLEGSASTASRRNDARGRVTSAISAPPAVARSAPATRNATSSDRDSISLGRPFGQSRYTPCPSASMLTDRILPVQSHATLALFAATSLASQALDGSHVASHASREPTNAVTAPQASSHAGALLPSASTPQWWCRACSACTSRSHAESEERHVAGARAPHTGACHDSVSFATTPRSGMRLEQSASAAASATRGARARNEDFGARMCVFEGPGARVARSASGAARRARASRA